MLVGRDGAVLEVAGGIGEGVGLLAEEGLDLGGVGREDGLEGDGHEAEEVEGAGEDGAGGLGVFLDELPGHLGVEELVGLVGPLADDDHGAAEVAALVGLAELGELGAAGGEEVAALGVHGAEAAAAVLVEHLGAAGGEVGDLADEVGVDAADEVLEVQVHVVDGAVELAGVVEAESLGGEVLEVGGGGDEGAFALGHLGAVDHQEAVDEDLRGRTVAGVLELGGPEEAVEADDVLADEVVDLGLGVLPPVLEGLAAFLGPGPEGGHVADGGVEPDVEILVVVAGDFEAEVGSVAGDVPAAEGFVEPLEELVGGALVGVVGEPLLEEVAAGLELDEELLALAHDGGAAADGAVGVLEVGGVVGGAADRAVVAVAVGRAAAGAGALDEAVGQEHAAVLAVELVDGARGDEAALLEA